MAHEKTWNTNVRTYRKLLKKRLVPDRTYIPEDSLSQPIEHLPPVGF